MPLTNIYALCEPGSQTPRYIGQTTFPLGHRLSNHVASAKRGKSSNGLSTWVNGLVYNGQRPVIVLLEECAPDEADNTETRLGISQRAIINACKREGWPWRKIYGRIWVCADFADRYEAKYGTL